MAYGEDTWHRRIFWWFVESRARYRLLGGSDPWQWDSLAVRTFPIVLEGKKERSGEGREDFFQQIGEF